jgi:hypothetical protein
MDDGTDWEVSVSTLDIPFWEDVSCWMCGETVEGEDNLMIDDTTLNPMVMHPHCAVELCDKLYHHVTKLDNHHKKQYSKPLILDWRNLHREVYHCINCYAQRAMLAVVKGKLEEIVSWTSDPRARQRVRRLVQQVNDIRLRYDRYFEQGSER